ncbi:hypothetical protein [Brevundimonas basaltis]|uniref:Uncharacterized protein n=1 Tax=Brevundimonas basaltis TaxID=472166 RepID=A0A7W8HY54_9CAUL|nr:hypothetical protein [Brevundimonas basaltis]MBB5292069.1 hypothetical protein [Brevundimonas basaltis]
MPSFASDASLRTFLRTEPPSVQVPPPPPPLPPLPISHHDRPVPGLPRNAPPPGPIQHDPPGYRPVDLSAPVPGIDGGDLVQAVGDNLVILRRGRLFSIATVGDRLETVGWIEAFAPGAAALRDWAEQMFVVGDTVAVVAFSAARGGTEISRFRVSPTGELSWIDTHQLDRGGPSGVAAQVVDGQLVLVSLEDVNSESGGDPLDLLPAAARWSPDGWSGATRLVDAGEVFVAAPLRSVGGGRLDFVSVTRCDLAAADLECHATSTLAPGLREYHVATDAVYVWTQRPPGADRTDPAWLYRIPHRGRRPGAVQVFGDPVSPSAFGLGPAGTEINVLVKRARKDDAGEAPQFALGRPALLRLPLTRFGDGGRTASEQDYIALPGPADARLHDVALVHGAALFAHKPWNSSDQRDELVAVPAGATTPVVLDTASDFYRITPMGHDAVASGAGAGLPFNVVDLDRAGGPILGPRYEQPDTREYESRAHPFRYRPDPDSLDLERGLLALPVGDSLTRMDVLFLRRDGDRLAEAGRLTATAMPRRDDNCRASCSAWNRDVRPIFAGRRIFALLGYELVEGELTPEGAVREVRRLDFTPPTEAALEEGAGP